MRPARPAISTASTGARSRCTSAAMRSSVWRRRSRVYWRWGSTRARTLAGRDVAQALPRVVEDDPQRHALAGAHRRDAVAHRGAVVAARAADRSDTRREDRERAALEPDHVRARLRARALLDEDELAALEVGPGAVEDGHRLQREGDVAVEVLVQRVVAALDVAQDQRRRAVLVGGVAALEERLEVRRVAGVLAQPPRPVVRQRGQRRVQGVARLVDERGQRRVEVLVLALAEAMASHVD